jgi:hypothetical protein
MLIRCQIGFPMTSTLPRDVVTINPHYDGDDPQALCDVLKANIRASSLGVNYNFSVKAYDAMKPPPSYPLASSSNGTSFNPTSAPGEVALCLSYFATFNRPSFRGRLFLPATWFSSAPSTRPTDAIMDAGILWAKTLWEGLPSGTFGIVFSRKKGSGAQITDAWIDDEWDTVRSRGLKSTKRKTYKLATP